MKACFLLTAIALTCGQTMGQEPAPATPTAPAPAPSTAAPQTEVVTPRAGSVTGITLSATVAPAGTDAVFTVTKNGSAISGCILTVTAGATLGRSATFTPGTYPIAASDRLGVTVTTGAGWTATTSDVAVCVEVETE